MKAFNLHIFRLNVVCKCLNFWDFSNGKYIYLSKHVKVFLKSSTNGLQYIVVSFTIHVSQNCFAYLTFVHWYISSCRKSIILLNSEISYQNIVSSYKSFHNSKPNLWGIYILMENDHIRPRNDIRAIDNLALQIVLWRHWRHNCSRAVTNHFRLLPLLLYQSGFEVDIIYKAYCPPLITSFAIVVWKGTLICAWQPTYVNRHANKKSSFLYPISWDLGIYNKDIHSFVLWQITQVVSYVTLLTS